MSFIPPLLEARLAGIVHCIAVRHSDSSFYLHSRRILLPKGVWSGAVHIRNGRIQALLAEAELPTGAVVEDFGDKVLLPGLVDTHAHINEPGRTEWEGFETATRAAAAGGITTVVDMPLNSIPPTTSVEALEKKASSAAGHCWIDYAFWGGVIPGNAPHLVPLIRAGVRGFKTFLIDSGVEEFPATPIEDLRKALPLLAPYRVPLLVHAELAGNSPGLEPGSQTYAQYLASRPRDWEDQAIREMISLCRQFRCPVHIVHLSSSSALPDLRAAKNEGLPLSVETCPHYLIFTAEEIPKGATHFKCAPPIRERENRERLWQGLLQNDIDFVVSDHSPCSPELKALEAGDFYRAWGGISSLQFGLSLVWTELRHRGLGFEWLARWMCERTARFAGLTQKGAIAVGKDADIVVWDPDRPVTIGDKKNYHRHALTPYAGRKAWGEVEVTFLRGNKVYDRGEFGPSLGVRL